ncbi:MAG: hypothetical protein WAM14_03835 [Candidatus Nitrosopolaris sp.]
MSIPAAESLPTHGAVAAAVLAVNQAKFVVVGMLAVISALEDGGINKVVMINFDDGYTSAKPILDKYGFKASFFEHHHSSGRNATRLNT